MSIFRTFVICTPIILMGMAFSYTFEAGAICAALCAELNRLVRA